MRVTFWGVRGSITCPGAATVRYGGNTSCVSVQSGDQTLVFDAGTGIRALGRQLAGSTGPIFLLFSHPHLDHLQGFPYFAPVYEAGRELHIVTPEINDRVWSPMEMLDAFHFPRGQAEAASDYVEHLGDPGPLLDEWGWDVRTISVNHPGGAIGFRVRRDGRTFAHVPDNELRPPGTPAATFDEIAEFCRGADLLSHDSQYVESDLPAKEGWGHSLVSSSCELAVEAGVSRLVLFHHDPDRSDDDLDRLQDAAREYLGPHGIACDAAHDGLEFDLSV